MSNSSVINNPPEADGPTNSPEPGKHRFAGFNAALIATSIFLPAAAAFFTIIFVLLNWNIPSSFPANVEWKVAFTFFNLVITLPGIHYSPIMGILAALVAWALAGVICRRMADAKHGIPSSYCEILPRLNKLEVELGNLPATQHTNTAYLEAQKEREKIDGELVVKGFGWVLATGYSNIWNRLYRCEEALIEIAPKTSVLQGAFYDEARLDGSDMKNRDDLLAKLRRAVITIDPSAREYLISTKFLAPSPALEIGTTALPEAIVAGNYCVPLFAAGGAPPYTWSVVRGTIPEGLQLSPEGVLRGTPTKDGNANFTVRITDSAGVAVERYFDAIVKPSGGAASPLAFATIALPSGTEGVPYEVKLFATGGTPPYTWSFSKPPTVGIELKKEGILSWKVPGSGNAGTLDVQVTDGSTPAPQNETRQFTLEIKPKQSIAEAPAGGPGPEQLARGVLRHVRESLNLYRQSRWDGLIMARNRLLATFMLTSMIVFALLAIALMFGDEKSCVIAALVFFLVGATIGLSNRLRNEAQAESGIHDYGLSAARLITVPLFSGLAAIGGILFVSYLPLAGSILTTANTAGTINATNAPAPNPAEPETSAVDSHEKAGETKEQAEPSTNPGTGETAPQPQTQPGGQSITDKEPEKSNDQSETNGNKNLPPAPKLKDIFDLDINLIGIFVAAVFGIAPGLLFDKLQSQADRFKTELKNSQSTGGSKSS